MSHEYPEYKKLENECKTLISELLNIPKNYKVFFMEGGATGQFAATAMNLLGDKGSVGDYLVTGTWSRKAAEDCTKMGGIPNRIMSDDAKVFPEILLNFRKEILFLDLLSMNLLITKTQNSCIIAIMKRFTELNTTFPQLQTQETLF